MDNLNIRTPGDVGEVRAALTLMEGEGYAKKSGAFTLDRAVEFYRKALAEGWAIVSGGLGLVFEIYGAGGVHRYKVGTDGLVYFSGYHAGRLGGHDRRKAEADALDLGFRLVGDTSPLTTSHSTPNP